MINFDKIVKMLKNKNKSRMIKKVAKSNKNETNRVALETDKKNSAPPGVAS
jgi:hypothetical protein